ncbi:hypothetical protein MFU01_68860 [Myxococcus fulvus]|uniref:Uncharacterized protein n=1 Tax=Myxococcus fulvus TaxID=33 RepID=A0A511TCE4_MYXFU|nr:hypothetical protein MFU01_68860 [Myxococcus fulvus]
MPSSNKATSASTPQRLVTCSSTPREGHIGAYTSPRDGPWACPLNRFNTSVFRFRVAMMG